MPPQRRTSRSRSPSARPSVEQSWRRLLVGALSALSLAYLVVFLASGEARAEIYHTLGRVYLLLPDDLAMFLWNEWTQGGPVTVLDRAGVFAVAALLLTAGWGAGRLCLPRAAAAMLGMLETALFSIAIGLNVWSLYALLVGICGGLHWPWLIRAPMLATFAAAVWREWASRAGGGRTDDKEVPNFNDDPAGQTRRRMMLCLAGLSLPLVLLYLLTAALPPWEFDVREYHLQVPKEWFQQGRIGFLPHNVYGNMPLGAEMQALLGMSWMAGPRPWWYGAIAYKVVMACLGLATALALYAFGRRYASPLAGAVAALVYLSLPWVFHVSTVGLIEGAVGFYLWMTFHAAWIGFEALKPAKPAKREESPPPFDIAASSATGGRQLVGLAGFLAGSAIACKYPSLLFVGLPLLSAVAWKFLRAQPRLVLTCWLLMAVACGPWFVKNAAFTGNPVYPLAYGLFGGKTWNEDKDARWKRGHGPPRDSRDRRFSAPQLATSIAGLGWSHDFASPLVWPLAMFCLLAKNGRRGIWLSIIACLVVYFIAWWLLTHRMERFFVPALPLAAMLAGVGATWSNARGWRWTVLTFVTGGVLLNLLVFSTGRLTGYTPIFVPLEDLRNDQRPDGAAVEEHRVDAPHRYLNRHVPPGMNVLLVGDAQPFDLEVGVFYSTCWDDCILETWTRGRSRQERLQTLREHRISHVLVNWQEITRYRSPGNYGFTGYITPELVRNELVAEQGLLRPVSVPLDEGEMDPDRGQLFEVVYE